MPNDARNKLRNMGGIMASYPELMQETQYFQAGGDIDTRSGLERFEAETEAQLLSDSPTVRALRLSEIGGNIGEFINEVGINAIRQADALLAGGASLSNRGAAAGTAALGALTSILGAPKVGAALERASGRMAGRREEFMSRQDPEGMPFGINAPRLFTSATEEPFEIPQAARNLYTQAETMRKLENLPEDSAVFAEGAPVEDIPTSYGLLEGSRGVSPSGITTMMPSSVAAPPVTPTGARPSGVGLAGAPARTAPSRLSQFDVSTGSPVSMRTIEEAALPSQEELDLNFERSQNREDVFPNIDAPLTRGQPETADVPLMGEAQGIAPFQGPMPDEDAARPEGIEETIGEFLGDYLVDPALSQGRRIADLLGAVNRRGQERARLRDEDTVMAQPVAPVAVEEAAEETEAPAAAETEAAEDTTDPLLQDVDRAVQDPQKAAKIQEAAQQSFEELTTRPSKGGLRQRYDDRLALFQDIFGTDDKDEARDRAMSLAMMGLAIASGQSPNALTNIAQGAMAGLQGMSEQEQARRAQEQGMKTQAFETVLAEMEAERDRAAKGTDFGARIDPISAYTRQLSDLRTQASDTMGPLYTELSELPYDEQERELQRRAFEVVRRTYGDLPPLLELGRRLGVGTSSPPTTVPSTASNGSDAAADVYGLEP
jgi:hypothetical protein